MYVERKKGKKKKRALEQASDKKKFRAERYQRDGKYRNGTSL